ncbi:MAG: hypothetical protein QMD82_02520 [bacterium]|nr:hypothetical protein [bacterium]
MISGFISVEQDIRMVDITVRGSFSNVEVQDFPYEGVLTIDIKGIIKGDFPVGNYPNSFVKKVEIKRVNGIMRIICKMAGPFEIAEKITSGDLIRITLKPVQGRISLETEKHFMIQSQPPKKVRAVVETVFVTRPQPVYLKCKDLTGAEISEFIKAAAGKSLVLPSNKKFSGHFGSPSLEKFLEEFPAYFEKYAK